MDRGSFFKIFKNFTTQFWTRNLVFSFSISILFDWISSKKIPLKINKLIINLLNLLAFVNEVASKKKNARVAVRANNFHTSVWTQILTSKIHTIMNFLLLLALFSLCLANFHSHSSLEERIRNQLIKKEAFLQEKLLNVQFPENENKVSSKRDEEYINVTDKVTITPWYEY